MAGVKDTAHTHLLKAFDEGKGIFADSLLDSVKGLSAAQAAWVPEGTEHSIGAIVNHVTYWKNMGVGAYSADMVPEGPKQDWQPVNNETDWKRTLDQLKQSQTALLGALDQLTEDQMDDTPKAEGWPSWKEVFLGYVAHDAYHTAQVVKLRELQGAPVS